jgi:DNA excision repair protein ERCC-4
MTDDPVFVVDSREQKPYRLEPAIIQALPTGDYSIAGLEDQVAIERKSLDDLVQSLSRERDRFTRELERGASMPYFALVIEGTLEDLAAGRYQSKMSVKSAVQSVFALSIRFRLPVWFVHDRKHGRRVVESLLSKYHRNLFLTHKRGGEEF